jgi:hypothetical protein
MAPTILQLCGIDPPEGDMASTPFWPVAGSPILEPG